jgi:hypothetical protein
MHRHLLPFVEYIRLINTRIMHKAKHNCEKSNNSRTMLFEKSTGLTVSNTVIKISFCHEKFFEV